MKRQETPNLLNLSDPAVIKILGNLTELVQPANWGEGSQKVKDGGAYLCMNDKGGEVYIIQKDENGNPESYQPTLSFAANLQQLQDKKDASVSADSSVSASGKKSTTRSK